MALRRELVEQGLDAGAHTIAHHLQLRLGTPPQRYLQRQAAPENLAHLQMQLDVFRVYYHQHRPHRAIGGRTPFQAFQARLKAQPSASASSVQYRVRRDKLDSYGKVKR